MTSDTFTETAMAALGGLDKTAEAVNPDTDGSSSRNRWPDDGLVNCWLKYINVEDSEFNFWIDGKQNKKDGVCITFGFTTMDQADGENWDFEGAVFRFPKDYEALKGTLPPNVIARVEIETSRLMGHLTTMLGARPANVATGLKEVVPAQAKRLSEDNLPGYSLTIKRDVVKRGDRSRTYPKEFITEALSVETAG